jgi:hypothetical protein
LAVFDLLANQKCFVVAITISQRLQMAAPAALAARYSAAGAVDAAACKTGKAATCKQAFGAVLPVGSYGSSR